MGIIRISNLSIKPFNKLTMDFPVNSFSVIAGANKSGKTLLVKVIASLVYTKNKVFYKDLAIENYNYGEISNDISFLLSTLDFSFNTVIEEIKYPLEALKFEKEAILKMVKSISRDLKISSILNSRIEDISYYEKLKVMLAKALIVKPKVLLLDDPCKYLSNKEREALISILNQFQRMGLTIIMTTSNFVDFIYTVNSTLFILKDGDIVSSGDMMEVLGNDSLINKAGLELPFMVDLCVKLRYYGLISKMELDPVRLVNILWK